MALAFIGGLLLRCVFRFGLFFVHGITAGRGVGLFGRTGDFLRVEGEPQRDVAAVVGTALLVGFLPLNAGVVEIGVVYAGVVPHASDVKPYFPQAAFGFPQGQSDHFRNAGQGGGVVHADDEGDAGAEFGFGAGPLGDGAAFVLLVEDVVGGHVGPVNEFLDFESFGFEHVFSLTQRVAGDVGDDVGTGPGGIDSQKDATPGFDAHAGFGTLVEDGAGFLFGHVQGVDHFEPQFAFGGHGVGFGDGMPDQGRDDEFLAVPRVDAEAQIDDEV